MKRHFMTFMKFSLITFSLAGFAFMAGCGDDDSPTVDPLIGDYKLSAATYLGLFNPADGSTAAVAMTVVPLGEIPVNSPISELATGVLNGVPDCTDATATQIEFHDDGTLWITCNGTADASSGTWTKADDTTVTLNIAPTDAIPTGLSLTISSVVIAGSNLSGRVDGFPLPKHLGYGLGEQLPDSGGPNLQLISLTVVLTKQ